MEKINGWKKYFQWIQTNSVTQLTFPSVGHVDIVEFRCKLCEIYANQCVWKQWRVYDNKTQKFIFKNHDADIIHAKFVKLHVDVTRNDTFWQKQAEENAAKSGEKREELLNKKRDQIHSILWLAKEETSIGKYRSLHRNAAELEGSIVAVSSHSSVKAGWVFLESTSDVILKRDCSIIRDAEMHSLIFDSTNDGNDWVAVLAR